MLSQPVDILFIFALTVPFIGVLASKVGKKGIAGVYASLGIALSGYSAYNLLKSVMTSSSTIPEGAGSFFAYLQIDVLGTFLAITQIGLGLFAAIYSIRYMEKDSASALYYSLLLGMIAGMVGVVLSGDLFTLFVFWELMSVTSYLLVAFKRTDWEPIEAGMKYLIMSSVGSVTALFGMSLLYGMTGTMNFADFGALLTTASSSPWFHIIFLLFLIGFGVKAAIVPLHTWLPDAHSAAPSPISAMLSGIVIETGIFAIFKITFTAFSTIHVDWILLLALLSVATMTLGNLSALLQTDLKRMLAYSSIGHVGYMLIGIAAGTQLGLTGTIFHIFNHMLMKGTAFLCAGAIIYRLGSREIDDMNGIARKMPITSIAFIISLFGLIGMPGINGFVSKLILFVSAADANLLWVGIFLIINSAISAGYYLRVLRAMMQPPTQKVEGLSKAPGTMIFPIVIMAILMVLFGLWPDIVLNLAESAAAILLPT